MPREISVRIPCGDLPVRYAADELNSEGVLILFYPSSRERYPSTRDSLTGQASLTYYQLELL